MVLDSDGSGSFNASEFERALDALGNVVTVSIVSLTIFDRLDQCIWKR